MRVFNLIAIIVGTVAMSLSVMGPAQAQGKKRKAERLVRDATETLRYFHEDDDVIGFHDLVDDAKAIIVAPDTLRGGFVFGGSGGNAVMIARNKDGSWSGPTFMTIGSFSFGLQAGGEVSEIVLLAMTNRGKERLLSSTAKLGADVSVAAGPVGGGAKAKTVDILAFSRSRGLYGGISLEGSILKIRHSWNRAYYDDPSVTPTDIVFRGVRDNPASLPLREMASLLASRGNGQPEQLTIGQTNSAIAQGAGQISDRSGVLVQPTQAGQETVTYEDDIFYENEGAGGAPLKTPSSGAQPAPYR